MTNEDLIIKKEITGGTKQAGFYETFAMFCSTHKSAKKECVTYASTIEIPIEYTVSTELEPAIDLNAEKEEVERPVEAPRYEGVAYIAFDDGFAKGRVALRASGKSIAEVKRQLLENIGGRLLAQSMSRKD